MPDGPDEPVCFVEFPCSDDEFPQGGCPVHSVDGAYAALDEARARDSAPQEGREPAAWATVVFRRTDGREIQVGQSDAGWILILLRTPSTPTRISVGENPPPGRVVFFLPEWTDLEGRHVVPAHLGREALGVWLRGGDPASIVNFEA